VQRVGPIHQRIDRRHVLGADVFIRESSGRRGGTQGFAGNHPIKGSDRDGGVAKSIVHLGADGGGIRRIDRQRLGENVAHEIRGSKSELRGPRTADCHGGAHRNSRADVFGGIGSGSGVHQGDVVGGPGQAGPRQGGHQGPIVNLGDDGGRGAHRLGRRLVLLTRHPLLARGVGGAGQGGGGETPKSSQGPASETGHPRDSSAPARGSGQILQFFLRRGVPFLTGSRRAGSHRERVTGGLGLGGTSQDGAVRSHRQTHRAGGAHPAGTNGGLLLGRRLENGAGRGQGGGKRIDQRAGAEDLPNIHVEDFRGTPRGRPDQGELPRSNADRTGGGGDGGGRISLNHQNPKSAGGCRGRRASSSGLGGIRRDHESLARGIAGDGSRNPAGNHVDALRLRGRADEGTAPLQFHRAVVGHKGEHRIVAETDLAAIGEGKLRQRLAQRHNLTAVLDHIADHGRRGLASHRFVHVQQQRGNFGLAQFRPPQGRHQPETKKSKTEPIKT